MSYLKVKPGVRFDVIKPAGFRILAALDQVAKESGIVLEITCGSDSHPLDDPHSLGEAYDISTSLLQVQQIQAVRLALIALLPGDQFTVLFECPRLPPEPLASIAFVNEHATGQHFHCQRKRGTSWPRVAPPTGISHA